jgi:hypothetical protein
MVHHSMSYYYLILMQRENKIYSMRYKLAMVVTINSLVHRYQCLNRVIKNTTTYNVMSHPRRLYSVLCL